MRPPAMTRSYAGGVCDRTVTAANRTLPAAADIRTLFIARTSMAGRIERTRPCE
jgi:hypothetical protein